MTDLPLIGLGLQPRIGGKVLRALLAAFGSPDAVLAADEYALRGVVGVGPQTAQQIRQINLTQLAQQVRRWQADNIQILTWNHDAYPPLLKPLDDAPPVLFKIGHWPSTPPQTLAIVGTREPSETALQFTQLLAFLAARHGWTIVSGMARGIDQAAHMGALAATPDGQTVAVLGEGVRHAQRHRPLTRRILEKGALFAEVAPDVTPAPTLLVARNRIISGMSRAVVMIEAGERSGALYTVGFARQQGHPVFTVDLPAVGNQRLIQGGVAALEPTENGVLRLLASLA